MQKTSKFYTDRDFKSRAPVFFFAKTFQRTLAPQQARVTPAVDPSTSGDQLPPSGKPWQRLYSSDRAASVASLFTAGKTSLTVVLLAGPPVATGSLHSYTTASSLGSGIGYDSSNTCRFLLAAPVSGDLSCSDRRPSFSACFSSESYSSPPCSVFRLAKPNHACVYMFSSRLLWLLWLNRQCNGVSGEHHCHRPP